MDGFMRRPETSVFADKMQQMLYELMKNYELCEETSVAQYGVTASQGYTLLALPQDSQMTMNELSENMGLANSTMTRMIDHLVNKRLVHRRNDDEDRRIVRVGLTTKGQEVRQALEKDKQELMQFVLAEIREDERPVVLRAIETVTQLLGKAVKSCCAR